MIWQIMAIVAAGYVAALVMGAAIGYRSCRRKYRGRRVNRRRRRRYR